MKANIIKTQQYLYVKLTHRQHVLIRHKHLKLLIADIQTKLKCFCLRQVRASSEFDF